jgi:hypothetical protein
MTWRFLWDSPSRIGSTPACLRLMDLVWLLIRVPARSEARTTPWTCRGDSALMVVHLERA